MVTTAFACGDKLSAMGGGVRFERLHQAARPGRLVVYLPQRSSLRTADSELRLVELLRRAGHAVRVVERPDEFERVLGAAETDLVLVGASDLRDIATAPAPGAARATLVRLDYGAAPYPRDADRCVTRLTRRNVGSLVRTIDGALQRRENGDPRPCE